MTALGKTPSAEARKASTWRLIDIKSGEDIACWGALPNWEQIISALERDGRAHWNDNVHCAQILTEGHPLECAEYITVNGKPAAFVSWDLHPISADEMMAALYPIELMQAAE